MKKILFYCAGLLLLASCNQSAKTENDALKAKTDSLQAQLAKNQSDMDEVLSLFSEVQDGFSLINQAEGRINVSRTGSAENRQAAKAQIQEDMQFIVNTMKSNKDRISALQHKLNSGQIKSVELQKTLTALQNELVQKNQQLSEMQAQLEERNIVIEGLSKDVSDLNSNVTELTTQNEHKAKIVADQDKNLNTAWFVFGTKSELKEKHIVEGDDVLKGSYDKGYFTKVDIRTLNAISLLSKKAKVLTSHPASSYELVKGGDKMLTLKITDPTKFWSVSRYLVVRVW
ncbi:MAG: hypothetical protein WCQ86_00695 [Bacteroidaceae bacterium]